LQLYTAPWYGVHANFIVLILSVKCLFFFSSRRRHTRLVSDWSSDVCSSDLSSSRLIRASTVGFAILYPLRCRIGSTTPSCTGLRSEERRVGKECRSRGSRDH